MEDANEKLICRLRDIQALTKLVGDCPAFRQAIVTLPAAARGDTTVLITGETGTGKELVARAIHYLSDRAAHPFVAVNCGSLTDTLLEDELFGHEPGAFTDARHRRPGLIAQAEDGTLFLDEIDTLTMRGQVALLRVLQDKVFRPLGSQHEQRAHVRFVAATNTPVGTLVDSGNFRADLYYRLCVFTITLPPLRERSADILPLSSHFLEKHAPPDVPVPSLSAAAEKALVTFAWPGNVRELENVMIRAARLADGGTIEVVHLVLPTVPIADYPQWPEASLSGQYRTVKGAVIRAFERQYLTHLMHESRGNVSQAARLAGKERRDLGRLLKTHGLLPERFTNRPLRQAGWDSPAPG